ncbi:ATP-binding protein [Streptomyces sp. BF23-18]|uniref:ATP-binding protein n=1 Tax=Streptomyces sp. BF23-18 TaxID=3240282 RepID=UPI0034E38C24
MTTAVQTPREVRYRDGDVMGVSFEIACRRDGTLPSPEDCAWAGAIRRIVVARLRYRGLDALQDAVSLIVSELLTNAIFHSGTTTISLTITVQDGGLCLSVADGVPGVPPPVLKAAGADAESGRGLALVDALVEENGGAWGTSDDGAVTWCRLVIPSGDQL